MDKGNIPSIIPNAVQVCHIMTSAPRIGAGAHSAEYTGTVEDFGPIPRPKTKRAMKRLTQLNEDMLVIFSNED